MKVKGHERCRQENKMTEAFDFQEETTCYITLNFR